MANAAAFLVSLIAVNVPVLLSLEGYFRFYRRSRCASSHGYFSYHFPRTSPHNHVHVAPYLVVTCSTAINRSVALRWEYLYQGVP